MSEYSSKLRDPRWQRKRLEIFEAAGWVCEHCSEETKELHAHHLIYKKGHSPWEYEDGEIIALCKDCHGMVTGLIDSLNKRLMVNRHGVEFLSHLCGYIDGFDGIIDITGNIEAYCAGQSVRETNAASACIRRKWSEMQKGEQ
jgi:hypothetical protein